MLGPIFFNCEYAALNSSFFTWRKVTLTYLCSAKVKKWRPIFSLIKPKCEENEALLRTPKGGVEVVVLQKRKQEGCSWPSLLFLL